ncbi:hypothetical protein V6N13_132634 [Hibiscus sabdariffa]|uniref:Uncharacterized protein n=1 Tax=Hibiscus sabdariffa TaxID=183260 RepID=A0ABR2PVW1_9ROSI
MTAMIQCQMGLLCTQTSPSMRPPMSCVVGIDSATAVTLSIRTRQYQGQMIYQCPHQYIFRPPCFEHFSSKHTCLSQMIRHAIPLSRKSEHTRIAPHLTNVPAGLNYQIWTTIAKVEVEDLYLLIYRGYKSIPFDLNFLFT